LTIQEHFFNRNYRIQMLVMLFTLVTSLCCATQAKGLAKQV